MQIVYGIALSMYFPNDFHNNIFFSLAYFTVKIEFIIHITVKIGAN